MQRPSLLQVNARTLVRRLAAGTAPVTLAALPDAQLDDWAGRGHNLLWLMGVWRTGAAGRAVSLAREDWRRDYDAALPGWTPQDVCGSCFAVTGYEVAEALGGPDALASLRKRLRQRGLRLILDFVPNHTALDHPWVTAHPERYVHGTEADLAREPGNYVRQGSAIFAYGRDPYFPGWPDTLQLNYAEPSTGEAMRQELQRIAAQCDGVRCDMAMLLLPDVFASTWGRAMPPFWPEAIVSARQQNPEFLFLAEAYWDREYSLQQQGFDATYDKRLLDRLHSADANGVRAHLRAGLDFQNRCLRFLENHDEPRAAAVFAPEHLQAGALVAYTSPGWRFWQEGQTEGARTRVPVHLCRAPLEADDEHLQAFYTRLSNALTLSAIDEGDWHLLECRPAWDGNPSHEALLCSSWQHQGSRVLCAANLAGHPSQGYVPWPFADLAGEQADLRDQLTPAIYRRDLRDLAARGLYLDLPAWGYHLFTVTPAA